MSKCHLQMFAAGFYLILSFSGFRQRESQFGGQLFRGHQFAKYILRLSESAFFKGKVRIWDIDEMLGMFCRSGSICAGRNSIGC